ncbi:MAG: histidine kinase, partial [Desulfovermiculus sp.]
AVEEQSITTKDIGDNVSRTAQSVDTIAENVSGTAEGSQQIATNIGKVNEEITGIAQEVKSLDASSKKLDSLTQDNELG